MTTTIFDIQRKIIKSIKENPLLWNDDPVERDKPTYTGFRSIYDNFLKTTWERKEFPVIIVDINSTKIEEVNDGYFDGDKGIIMTGMDIYDKNNVTLKRESVFTLFNEAVKPLIITPTSRMLNYEATVGAMGVSCISFAFDISNNGI